MKAYTDIKQSKKMAEILPLESADMHYNNVSIKGINYVDEHRAELMEYNRAIKVLSKYTINPLFEVIPCWSLAALLDVLDDIVVDDDGNDWNLEIHKEDGQYYLNYHDSWGNEDDIETDYYDDLVDACYEIILKLHEKNFCNYETDRQIRYCSGDTKKNFRIRGQFSWDIWHIGKQRVRKGI